MKIALYIEGLQGKNTLIDFLKYSTNLLIVLPEGFDNSEIIKICEEKALKYLIRKKKKPIELGNLNLDLLISSQFQFKIAPEEYNAAKNSLNLHGSILPTYKGKNSDVWSLINDEKILGMTVHRLNEKFDDGEILHIEEVKIHDGMQLDDIYASLTSTIPKVVEMIMNESIFSLPEHIAGEDIFWRVRNLEDSKINWHMSVRKVFLFIRALSRDPIYAFSYYKGVKYSFKSAEITKETSGSLPGTVVVCNGTKHIVCGDKKLLRIIEIIDDSDSPLTERMVLH